MTSVTYLVFKRHSRMRHGMSDCNFYTARFEYPPKWCTVWSLHGWCHVKLLLSRRTFCLHHTEPCTSLQCHCSTTHTYRIYIGCMCLAVTCHQRFWQNDWDFLRASAVTRGWNGYQNKSQSKPRPFDPESDDLPLSYPRSPFTVYIYVMQHFDLFHLCRTDSSATFGRVLGSELAYRRSNDAAVLLSVSPIITRLTCPD